MSSPRPSRRSYIRYSSGYSPQASKLAKTTASSRRIWIPLKNPTKKPPIQQPKGWPILLEKAPSKELPTLLCTAAGMAADPLFQLESRPWSRARGFRDWQAHLADELSALKELSNEAQETNTHRFPYVDNKQGIKLNPDDYMSNIVNLPSLSFQNKHRGHIVYDSFSIYTKTKRKDKRARRVETKESQPA